MTHRIGTFFMLLGGLLIGLFLLSDIAQAPMCGYLAFGGLLLGLGILMWFRDPLPPPKPSGRFRLFRSAPKDDNDKR